MGNRFVEVEKKHQILARSYDEGELDADQFAQALAELGIQDEQEQWWQIQANGKWLRYNGEEWEEASPPRPLPPPPPREALLPPPRQTPEQPPTRADSFLREEIDDSIFFQTGVPAEEIPGLLDPDPAPGAFLLERKHDSAAHPLAVRVTAAIPVSPPPPPAGSATPSSAAAPSLPPQPVKLDPEAQSTQICPKCHKQVPPGAHFCKYCGTRPDDPSASACPDCHQPLLPNARFCGKCGHAVGAASCPKCHTAALPGARFCKNCGQALG
jgi:hypothetical protein